MKRFFVCLLLTGLTALGTEGTSSSVPSDQTLSVTFNKDVLPVLQQNCQTCHRPGGIAPMSLVTYEGTRPWAKAIKTAVLNKQMPPWFADPHVGEFRNAPTLTPSEINKLVAWADSGAREGDSADKPADRQWADGWRIQPDVVVSMQEPYHLNAKGTGEIKEFFVPNPFKEDTWVSAIEIRPSNPSVVHHVIVQIPEQTMAQGFAVTLNKKLEGAALQGADVQKTVVELAAVEQQMLTAARDGSVVFRTQGGSSYSDMQSRLEERRTGQGAFMTMEAVYAPGSSPLDFRFTDSAKLIKGGKPIRIEVHYTPNGKETTDQTQVAFTLAKGPAQRRFIIMAPEHMADSSKPIPAGAANYETKGELTFNQDADLVWFMPHMHLRGKDMSYRLIYPDGREQTVLNVKYNFNWQLGYEVQEPIKVTKGTRMIVTAHHDNSANNAMNPTPNQTVPWGEMTAQEMMLPWFGVVVDRDAQPQSIASYRPPDLDSIGAVKQIPVVDGNILKIIQPSGQFR
jgi:hypothetical protein